MGIDLGQKTEKVKGSQGSRLKKTEEQWHMESWAKGHGKLLGGGQEESESNKTDDKSK